MSEYDEVPFGFDKLPTRQQAKVLGMRTYTVLLDSGEQIRVQGEFLDRLDGYFVVSVYDKDGGGKVGMFPEGSVRAVFEGELVTQEGSSSPEKGIDEEEGRNSREATRG